MEYVDVSVELITPPEEQDVLLKLGTFAHSTHTGYIERDGRDESRALAVLKNGHHSVLEHFNVTVKCVVDRATSHAIVRHRHCAFTQESTLYGKPDRLYIVQNPADKDLPQETLDYMEDAYWRLEEDYLKVREKHGTYTARDLLPNATATSLVITTNLRQWWWIMQVRSSPADSPRMHEFARLLNEKFTEQFPLIMDTLQKWQDKGAKTK